MSEKNTRSGRFLAVGQKINTPTRRLAVQLGGCLAAGAFIALAHATGDMSSRLALILAGVVLAVGGFNAGALSQHIGSKGGERNG